MKVFSGSILTSDVLFISFAYNIHLIRTAVYVIPLTTLSTALCRFSASRKIVGVLFL